MDSYSAKSESSIAVPTGSSIKLSSHGPARWTTDEHNITCSDQHWETWTLPRGGTIHWGEAKQASFRVASSNFHASNAGDLRAPGQEAKFATRVNSKGHECRLLYFHHHPCAAASNGAVQVLGEMTDTQNHNRWRLNCVTCPVGEDFSDDCCTGDPEEELSIVSGHVPPGSLWKDRKAPLGNMICRSDTWKRLQRQGYGKMELDLMRDEPSLLFGQMIASYCVRKITR